MNTVNLEMRDGVAWINIDDGKVNVMSAQFLEAITKRLDEARDKQAVTVIAGRAGIFSAGFDLNTLKRGPNAGREMMTRGVQLIQQFLQFPRPIVAMCTGHAYPMGAFLLLSADYRLGAAGNFRIGMNEVAIGITPPPFAVALARHRLTGAGVSLLTTAAMLNPEEARLAGYLDEVVAADLLENRTLAYAISLNGLNMDNYEAIKPVINERVLSDIQESLADLLAT